MRRSRALTALALVAATAHSALGVGIGLVEPQAEGTWSTYGVLRSLALGAKFCARALALGEQHAAEYAGTFARCDEELTTAATNAEPDPATAVEAAASASGCSTYCTSSTSTHGCVPVIGCTGFLSTSSGSPFLLTVSQVEGARSGKILYSLAAHPTMPQAPNGNTSYRCLQSPTKSTGTQFSGGTLNSCDGLLMVDFHAFMAAHPGAPGNPLMTGQTFYAQGVFKDPGAPGTLNYSDGLSFTVVP